MDLGLKGRRALVLGSTRGLGRAIAGVLAAEGAVVATSGRKQADADAAAREIGGGARGYALDLGDPASVAAAADRVIADLGGIDILVNNTGGPPPTPLADVQPDLWLRQFQVQFLSLSELTRKALTGMRQRKWGRVLISLSSGAVQPIPNLGMSNTLRGALIPWAKTLSNEVGADGVTVNLILPGRIHTERVDELDVSTSNRSGKSVEQVRADSRATIPLGRYGTVEEYASVAAFLVSDRAGYMTGCQIRVDGGYIRGV
ncbi:MAG: SDR family oxidoreductase [Rhodospirillales bacterium]